MSMREDRYQSMVEKLAAEIAEEAMQGVAPEEEEIDEETLDAIAEEVVAQAEAEEAAAEGEEEDEETEEETEEEIKEAAYHLASEIVKEASALGVARRVGHKMQAMPGKALQKAHDYKNVVKGLPKNLAESNYQAYKTNFGGRKKITREAKKNLVKETLRQKQYIGAGIGAGALGLGGGAYALNKQAAAPAMFKNLAQQIKAVLGGIKANASNAGLRVKDLGTNSLSKIDGAVINNPYKAIAAAAGIGGATGYAIGNSKEAEIYEAAIEKAASVFEEGLAIEKAALNAYKTAQIQKEAAELIFSELGLLD